MKVANETQQQLMAVVASYVNCQQQQQHRNTMSSLGYHYEDL